MVGLEVGPFSFHETMPVVKYITNIVPYNKKQAKDIKNKLFVSLQKKSKL